MRAWPFALFAALALARHARADDAEPAKLRRVWIGTAGGFTLVFHPSGANVCGTTEWTCSAENASVYVPSPASPVASGDSDVSAGFAGLASSLVGSVDVALSDGVLVGVRFGFYLHPYDVNVFEMPLQQELLEARATWVLGPRPLTTRRLGFRPYALLGFGVADMSASVDTTLVVNDPVAGRQRVTAWRVAGPLFVRTGLGVRFGNDRFGVMLAPLEMVAAFGSGGAVGYMPELAVMSAL